MSFSYSKWLELPLTTRVKLAGVFGVAKTGATEVFSNSVVKDGYAIKDLEEKMTREAMEAYLEPASYSEDDNLFDLVVEKVSYVAPAPITAQEVITKTTVTETVVRPVDIPPTQEQFERAKEVLKETEIVKEETHAETKKSTKK